MLPRSRTRISSSKTVPEQLDLKLGVLKNVDAALKRSAILASNTSSISDHAACRANEPPGPLHRHAFHESCAGVMQLVEVIRGLATSDETFDMTMALCENLEKKSVGG